MSWAKLTERLWLAAAGFNLGGYLYWFTDPTFQTVSGYGAGAVACIAMYEITKLRRRLGKALAALENISDALPADTIRGVVRDRAEPGK